MARSDHALFPVGGVAAVRLDETDLRDIQALCERCRDYFEAVTGAPPGPSAAHNLFVGLPPDLTGYDDKFLIGLADPDRTLIAVLEAFRDYPRLDCWLIGLLMIDPSYRRRGLGAQAIAAFQTWIGEAGFRLGVHENNTGALAFWRSLGFGIVETRNAADQFMRPGRLLVMERAAPQ